MSLISVLRTGVSGMNAQSNRISTVAENVQNSSTTGYKRNSAEFSSLLLDNNTDNAYNSGAVETTIRRAISERGSINSTTSKTDLAIQGNGFFIVQDENKASLLTRAGNFVVDGQTGNLVNSGGFTLMGFDVLNGEASPTVNGTDGMVPVNMAGLSMRATPSTTGTIAGNLSADTADLTGTLSPTNFSKKTSIVTFDKLGNSVTLDVYLGKVPASTVAPVVPENTWSASVYAPDGTALTSPALTLAFDANGKIPSTAAAGARASFTIPGGEAFTLDMSGATQLAGSYDIKGSANGKAPSSVTGTEFSADGTVYATYADGTRLAAFKVPLADVKSPDNLDPRAGNVFRTNIESGDIQIGFSGSGSFGTLKSSALEASNVDVSSELTTMIESQTVYTANSKVFMTGNELLETLMNLKR
ncbi:flagellar hook protein FlgE [Methylobacterium sp. J-068]|uniref:flagellar hook protein FlgE n=1 Tax=Methylobacterium sp. J-068 TaxID=2836649 RepID=UPI001FBA822A|nr:flagellar hook protein FlgE [Methylobacterium sp. J-068]MCJ2036278.1 flagellar hook protein FlgE [Methylobacterium sp. J-068]